MKRFIVLAAAFLIFLTGCSLLNNDKTKYENYSCKVKLEGGSGKASVASPATVVVREDGMSVELIWSSIYYDYMIVDEVRYDNEASDGANSVFTIPFKNFDEPFTVIADTTAMSVPHEIEYQLIVYSPTDYSDGSKDSVSDEYYDESSSTDSESSDDIKPANLDYVESVEMKYANQLTIDYYSDDEDNRYAFITIGDKEKRYYLKALDGEIDYKIKESLSEEITVINDVDNTYLVSTSVMDLVVKVDRLCEIGFSGTKASDWYIDEAADAMTAGDILYAGKYSAPDYELLVSKGCNFVIENTMIYHNPEVIEKLEELNIPVMVEKSSYENSPLGRLEWIKLYGVLYDNVDEATSIFDKQVDRINAISYDMQAGDKVAFFSVDSNGMITVRRTNDYIAGMIEMAGGDYVPHDISSNENALSTMKITLEDFYIGAVDADVLIYNSTIEGEIENIEELVAKENALSDFKAVKNKNVYCLSEGYFQKSSSVAEFIEELHDILMGDFVSGECFYKLKE